MANQEIREKLKVNNIHQWELAEAIGSNEFTFSKKMRHELPADKKEKVLQAIDKLVAEKGA